MVKTEGRGGGGGFELNFLSSSHIDIPCGACKIFYETRYKCTLAPRLADVGHVSEKTKTKEEEEEEGGDGGGVEGRGGGRCGWMGGRLAFRL